MSAAKGELTRGKELKRQLDQDKREAIKQEKELDWDLIRSKPTTKARIEEIKRQENS
jgi:hypothetical protein